MTLKYVTSIQGGALETAGFPEQAIPYRDNEELLMLV